jgi:integrase
LRWTESGLRGCRKCPGRERAEGRIRWITHDEEDHVCCACWRQWGEHEAAAFVTVLIDTGMRRGELLRLQPEDVDGSLGPALEDEDQSLARSVPLTDRAKDALAGRLPWRLDEVKLRRVWDQAASKR